MSKVLYNPLLENFSVEFDKYGDNPRVLTINAGEVKQFEDWEAEHLKKHLIDRLIDKNPPADKNYEAKRAELETIVEVL